MKTSEVINKLQKLLDNAKKQGHTNVSVEDIENAFPELKESEDERISKELIEYLKDQQSFISASDCRDKYEEEENNKYNSWIAWLKKKSEQKSADNVKPKFKIGDWIVSDYDNVAYIESISEAKYNLQCKDGHHEKMSIEYIDRSWHLWTIEDAELGDVLVDEDDNIGIFQVTSNNRWHSCIYLTNDNKLIGYYTGASNAIVHTGASHMQANTHPATKEQCDRLFTKMKEEGYMWDADKKELKKIEQKPESVINDWIEDYWQHKKVNNPYSYDKGEEIQFDHQGFVRFCKKYCKNPVEWSEKDENILSDAIFFIREYQIPTRDKTMLNAAKKAEEWLKSLKQRIRG